MQTKKISPKLATDGYMHSFTFAVDSFVIKYGNLQNN